MRLASHFLSECARNDIIVKGSKRIDFFNERNVSVISRGISRRRREGGGAEMEGVSFSFVVHQAEGLSPGQSEHPPPRAGSKVTLLIIKSMSNNTSLLERQLDRLGFRFGPSIHQP